MRRERSAGLTPALLASVLLHGGLAAFFLFGLQGEPKEVKLGKVVPVTLVTNASSTNLRPAVAADEVTPAQTETPVPDASPNLIAPATTPEPSPPTPTPPTPKPAPPPKAATPTPKASPPARPTPPTKAPSRPTTPTSTPAKAPSPAPTPKGATRPTATRTTPPTKSSSSSSAQPSTAAPTQRLDLDALAASLAASQKASGRPRSSGQQGPSRPPTDRQAQPDAGTADQVAAVGAMKEDIERLWNPNCEVEGGDRVTVRVRFTLNAAGAIVGKVDAGGQEDSADEVARVAADRAIRAVYQASPFPRLPPSYYNQRLTLNFKASDACR